MGEEDVIIPISLEINEASLSKLKGAISRITDVADKMVNRKGAKAIPLIDSENLKTNIAQINQLEAEIGKLQQKIGNLSARNLGTDFSKAIDDVREYTALVEKAEQSRKDAQNRLGGQSKALVAAEENIEKVKLRIEKIEQRAKNEGRALTEQEQAKIESLRQEALIRKNLADQSKAEAKNSYDVAVAEKKRLQEALQSAIQYKNELSEIVDDEKRTADYNADLESQLESSEHTLVRIEKLYRSIAKQALEIVRNNGGKVGVDESVLDKSVIVNKKVSAISQLSQAEQNLGKQKQANIATTNNLADAQTNSIKSTNDANKAAQTLTNSTNNLANATNQSANAQGKEANMVKMSATQFYYKLRAVKMLGFVINQANGAVTAFGKATINVTKKALIGYLRLIPGVNLLRKALDKTSTSQRKLAADTKATTKANNGFNMSLKTAVINLLKYGLGIRSLYVLMNKLRSAMNEGFETMATQFADVNRQLSSIVTSVAQIKAAITAMVEPLLQVIAPVLEKIANLVTEISYKVASFIAALTGRSYVYKAVRQQIQFAESLEETAEKAKEAKKQLSGLDKLNVINSDDDNDSDKNKDKDKPNGMAWTKVPIDGAMADWAKKFKDFLNRLLGPIKKAWNKMKKFVTDAWKYMLNELLKLGKSFAEAFWRVWEEPETQKIFENIFKILGDIFLIIGNIAKALRIAWEHNDNGYRILKAIRDIILIITDGLREMADYTVEWSKHLDFIPLFDALANNLEQKVVPAVKKVMDLIVILYEQILLKIVEDFIEKGLPQIIDVLGTVAEIIGIIAEKIRIGLQSGSNGIMIVTKFEDLLQIVMDGIKDCANKTKEWAETLDFRPLLVAIKNLLEQLKPPVQFLVDTVSSFWTNVLLPFWKYLLEDGGPKLLDLLGKIFGEKYTDENGVVWGIDFEHLTQVMNEFMPAMEKFLELAWEVLLQVIEDLGLAFDNFVNSGALDKFVEKFREWVENADPDVIAEKIERFAKILLDLKMSLMILSKFLMPVITGFMTLFNVFLRTSILTNLGKLKTVVEGLAGGGGAAAGGAGGGFAALAGSIGPVAIAIAVVVGVIALMIGAFGGVEETLAELKERFDMVKEKISEFAEKINFSKTIDNLKKSFDGLKQSMTHLRPLFELLLDVLAGAVTVILKTLIGAIDGLMLSLTGIVDFVSGIIKTIGGIIDVFIGLLTNDEGRVEKGIDDTLDGIGLTFLGAGEFIAGVINGIAEAVAGFVDEILPGLSEGVGKFVKDVKNNFAWLREQLLGDPIVIDIQDGIIESFGTWTSETAETVSGWVTDRTNDFMALAEGVGQETVNMKDKAVEGFTKMREEAGVEAEQFAYIAGEKFEAVKNKAEEHLESSKFIQFGKNAVKGLENGIKAFSAVLTAATTNANNLKNKFKTGLAASLFRPIGSNLINGLKSGMTSALSSALSTVSNICNQIANKAREAFKIHSPSKVFEDIGFMNDMGLVKGTEKGADDVEDAFEELIPSAKMLDTFYDKFMTMMTTLTDNVSNMFDTMAAYITDVMNSLGNINAMQNFNSQLADISTIKVPDIAKGYRLPSNSEFKIEVPDFDMSELPKIIKDAVVEAIIDTASLQTDDGTIILNLDGKEIFRAVKSENTKYKKQHGVSAFT